MNYFVYNKRLINTQLEPHYLFLHMKFGVLEGSEVNAFNWFKQLIDLPSVVFRHNAYNQTQMHSDWHILGVGNVLLKQDLLKRIELNVEKKRVSIIHHITNSALGTVLKMYTIAEEEMTPLMRPLFIDEILKTL